MGKFDFGISGGAVEVADAGSGFSFSEGGTTSDAVSAELGAVTLGDDNSRGADSGDGFDPSIHVGRDKRNADGSYTRKRGRRSSGGSAPSRTSSKSDLKTSVDTLSNILAVVHVGIAGITKTPELALEEGESKALAGSVVNVLEQFDLTPDPKIAAVIGLLMTAGTIYGPRMYLIRERLKDEKSAIEKPMQYMQ